MVFYFAQRRKSPQNPDFSHCPVHIYLELILRCFSSFIFIFKSPFPCVCWQLSIIMWYFYWRFLVKEEVNVWWMSCGISYSDKQLRCIVFIFKCKGLVKIKMKTDWIIIFLFFVFQVTDSKIGHSPHSFSTCLLKIKFDLANFNFYITKNV